MKNTKYLPGWIILFSFLFFACKTVKTEDKIGFENKYFGVSGINCTEVADPDGIDSNVGKLDCGCVTFNYDYGLYSNPGPLTRKEEFRRAFDTYHHIKFFEDRMIDPKVHKLFLDSVTVVDVRHKMPNDELMIDCSTCNATAVLTFKRDTYLYPFTMSVEQLDNDEQEILFIDKKPNQYKYYTDSNGKPALYVTPIQNRFKRKNCLSLNVDTSDCENKEIERILKSVYLKDNPVK
jgi:hypothetical protein